MSDSVWKNVKNFLSTCLSLFSLDKNLNGTSELLFDNLHSYIIGKFNENNCTHQTLDSAIRCKQNMLVDKLQIKNSDSFLDIDAEWGLLSHSLSAQYGVLVTAVFCDMNLLCRMQKLNSTFLQYRNIRAILYNECDELQVCNYLILPIYPIHFSKHAVIFN